MQMDLYGLVDVVVKIASDGAAYYEYFVLSKFAYATWLLTAANCINAATKVFEMQKGKPKFYWLHSLVLTVMIGFGGGSLAPVMLGKPSAVVSNDIVIPLTVIVWYAITYLGAYEFVTFTPLKLAWSLLLCIYRMNSVIAHIAMAMSVLTSGPFYPIPLIGPILLGTIAGTGGLFFPMDKGLGPIIKGTPWPTQLAFLTACFYHLQINDNSGLIGSTLRRIAGTHSETGAKMIIAGISMATTALQVLVHEDVNLLTPFHKALYLVFNVTGPLPTLKQTSSSTEPAQVGWDSRARAVLAFALESGRILVVVVAIAAHFYFNRNHVNKY